MIDSSYLGKDLEGNGSGLEETTRSLSELPNYALYNPVWIPLLIAVWCDIEIIFSIGVGWGGWGRLSYMQFAIHFAPYLIRAEIKLFCSRSVQTSYLWELQAVALRLAPLEMGGTRSTQRVQQKYVRNFS
jgi:hypothetical protein